MESLIIVLIIVVVIVVLFVLLFLNIKKKIQDKAIDMTAGAIKKTAEKYFDEETANKVNKGANFTTKIAKGGKFDLIKEGLKLAKERR